MQVEFCRRSKLSFATGFFMLPNAEKRKQQRYDFPGMIEYVANFETSDEPLKAVTVNISKSGLCLYIFEFLNEGQEIIIKSTLPIPFQRVTARWVKEIDDSFYAVGLTGV